MQYTQIKQCGFCGSTAATINSTGKLGCANCYLVFYDELLQTLKNLHPQTIHSGKIPKSAPAIIKNNAVVQTLKQELKEAIEREDFEKAAVIRDKIKEIKG